MATNYQIIPRRLTSSSLAFWLSIWRENFPSGLVKFRLSIGGKIVREVNLPKSEWQKRGSPPEKRIWHKWLELTGLGLQPRSEYQAEILIGDSVRATGVVKTLPSRIPRNGDVRTGLDKSFTVFVGSCYFQNNDPYGMVSDAYMKLWNDSTWQPDLKFLCGDQIYFDIHPGDFIQTSATPYADIPEWVRERLTRKYRNTWKALSSLLSHGATYMLTDDHEYWNDFPGMRAAPWVWNIGIDFRSWAHYIYAKTGQFVDAFQPNHLQDSLKVGDDIEFFLLDTRRNRSMVERRFAEQSNLDKAISWLKGLKSPGVLVMSSPIFVTTKGFKFGFGEHKLPYFDTQFVPLAHALLESKVDIVVVAGDPHFSSVAVAQVDNPHPHKIVEVVSSAMATIDESAGDPDEPRPNFFPMPRQAHPQISSAPIQYLNSSRRNYNEDDDPAVDNFVTLSFTRIPNNGIEMLVRSWMCKRRDNSQVQVPIDFERRFEGRMALFGEHRPVTEDNTWLVPVLTVLS